jgi:RHS repeat-associated protein
MALVVSAHPPAAAQPQPDVTCIPTNVEYFEDSNGPDLATNCNTGFSFACYDPIPGDPIVTPSGGCDPRVGTCSLHVELPITYPGNHQDDPNLVGGGYSFAFVGLYSPSGTPLGACGLLGSPILKDSGRLVWNTSGSCDSTPLVYPADITMCDGLCPKLANGTLILVGPKGTALCDAVPPPPPCGKGQQSCMSCVPGGGGAPPPADPAKPGKGGGGGCGVPKGGTGPAVCPPQSGPGATLRYLAGGVGHPSFPGSTEWNQELGRYWSFEWAERIVPDPVDTSQVWFLTREGGFEKFTDTTADPDGLYEEAAPSDEYRQLFALAGGGWELRDLDGTVTVFDAAGRWVETRGRNQPLATTTATYTGSLLTSVSFPDGTSESFTYSGSRLATIRRFDLTTGMPGDTWTYTWSGYDLMTIGRPDGTMLRFFYNDVRHPGYMTRMELVGTTGGHRVLGGWRYDDEGNVVTTWKGDTVAGPNGDEPGPGAVAVYTLSYDDPADPTETTVTDPLGKDTVYTMDRDPVSRRARITGWSGDCPQCGGSPAGSYQYGTTHPLLPERVFDARTVETDFEYGDRGQVTLRIDGANTTGDPTLPRETAWDYDTNFPAFPTVIDGPTKMGEVATRSVEMDYNASSGNLEERRQYGNEDTYPGGALPPLVTELTGYNSAGQVGTVDPPGYGTADQTTFTYDVMGRNGFLPDGRTDPLVGTTHFGYDGYNRRTSVTDPNGVETVTAYDPLDRVTSVTQVGDAMAMPPVPDLVTRYFYNPFKDLSCTVLPEGNGIEYQYDAAGRLTEVRRGTAVASPSGTNCLNTSFARERTLYTLDPIGHRIDERLETSAAGSGPWVTAAETAYEYSSGCHLDKVIQAPGQAGQEATTEYAYDCNGNLERVWDADHPSANQTNPATSAYSYDALDRVISVTQPFGGAAGGTSVTTYGYDVQDHLTSVTDAEQNTNTYLYSDRDLMTSETSPVSGTTTSTYNDHGELEETTDARGVTVSRGVDVADRVTSVTYPDSTLDTTYTYGDQEMPVPDFSRGRLTHLDRANGTAVDYVYDRFGRTIQDGELAYEYDLNGNRISEEYPGGVVATYTFDFADRQASLTVDDGVNPPESVASAASYEPFGPLAGLTLGNGLAETRDFGFRYQPTGIAAGTLLDWDYTTDEVGNVTAIADALAAANSRTYAYQDLQYFLTCAAGPWNAPGGDCSVDPPAGQPLEWGYDRIGNRLTETRAGLTDTYHYVTNGSGNTPILDHVDLGAGGTHTYAYGPAGHLLGIDAAGNQIDFTPDDEGRLAEVARPAAAERAELTYDGRSLLAKSVSFSPTVTVFADGFETGDLGCWSLVVGGPAGGGGAGCFTGEGASTDSIYSSTGRLELLRKRDAPGGAVRRFHLFYFAGRPVAQLEVDGGTSTWTYLTTDHLGTPVLATDASAAALWSGGFEPFGADYTSAPSAQQAGVFLRLPGQWADDTWQNASLGAELYQNAYRWLEVGTGRYSRVDPLGILPPDRDEPNPYLYVRGSPIGSIDPLGLDAFTNDTGVQDCMYCIFWKGGFGFHNEEEGFWLTCSGGKYHCDVWPSTHKPGNSRYVHTTSSPRPTSACGIFHTHPRRTPGTPSTCNDPWCDVPTANSERIPIYTVHPTGIWKYDPSTGQITQEAGSGWLTNPKKRCKKHPCQGLP